MTMISVRNTATRQYNLKALNKNGSRVLARVIPGLNEVDDTVWKVLETSNYVKGLLKTGVLAIGEHVDSAVLDEDSVVSQVKTDAVVSRKADLAGES